jgi:hypothetical protein
VFEGPEQLHLLSTGICPFIMSLSNITYTGYDKNFHLHTACTNHSSTLKPKTNIATNISFTDKSQLNCTGLIPVLNQAASLEEAYVTLLSSWLEENTFPLIKQLQILRLQAILEGRIPIPLQPNILPNIQYLMNQNEQVCNISSSCVK